MKIIPFTFLILAIAMSSCDTIQKNPVGDSLHVEAMNVLRKVLHEQQEWVKVHAAEYLLWSGNPEGVREVFLKEEQKWAAKSPYRIGIWRVLYQATANPTEKKIWLNNIMQAFLDTGGTDRIHAAETLAKLRVSPLGEHPGITAAALESPVKSLSLYTRWTVAFSSEDTLFGVRKSFLDIAISTNEDELSRKLAAYVVRNSGLLPDAEWEEFARAALSEPQTSGAGFSLLTAAVITAPVAAVATNLYQQVYRAFLQYKEVVNKSVRIDLAAGLGEKGRATDLPILVALLSNENPTGVAADDADVQAAAAYAILKMDQRLSVPMD